MKEEIEELKKSYYAVIPANVRYNKKIVDGAKLLYGEVTALCDERGYCWAGNEYFADLYGNTKITISRWFSSLVKENYLYMDMSTGRRKIFLSDKIDLSNLNDTEPTKKKATEPVKKKGKKETKKPAVKFTEEDRSLAELLLQKIIYNYPSFENKKVNISEWAEDIRKLREIDHATVQQIHFMITWLQGGEIIQEGKPTKKFEPHEFWSKNILSARKLRKQWFENLVPQLQDTLIKKIKKSTVTQL